MIVYLVFKVRGAFFFAGLILQRPLLCSVKITEHNVIPWTGPGCLKQKEQGKRDRVHLKKVCPYPFEFSLP